MPRVLDWLLPESPKVLEMLRHQAAVTLQGMATLQAWAGGDTAAVGRLSEIEHEADDVKRELRVALRAAFITPIGQEDLYTLSDRLDAVLTRTRDAVRESEVMNMPPDKPVAEMAALLDEGVHHIAEAFARLGEHSSDPATDAADLAKRAARRMEMVYRRAMSDLLAVNDLREVMGRRELYRRFSRISETLEEVADRVWYASVKEA